MLGTAICGQVDLNVYHGARYLLYLWVFGGLGLIPGHQEKQGYYHVDGPKAVDHLLCVRNSVDAEGPASQRRHISWPKTGKCHDWRRRTRQDHRLWICKAAPLAKPEGIHQLRDYGLHGPRGDSGTNARVFICVWCVELWHFAHGNDNRVSHDSKILSLGLYRLTMFRTQCSFSSKLCRARLSSSRRQSLIRKRATCSKRFSKLSRTCALRSPTSWSTSFLRVRTSFRRMLTFGKLWKRNGLKRCPSCPSPISTTLHSSYRRKTSVTKCKRLSNLRHKRHQRTQVQTSVSQWWRISTCRRSTRSLKIFEAFKRPAFIKLKKINFYIIKLSNKYVGIVFK